MTRFWELLEQSVIVQSLVTLGLVSAVIFLSVTGQEIPDPLLSLTLLAIGFYFGSKGALTGRQAAEAAIQQLKEEEKDHA